MSGDQSPIARSSQDEIADPELRLPLYARVMGEEFRQLSRALRSIHQVVGERRASGRATVEIGSNWCARFIAAMMRLPPAGDHHLLVDFREFEGGECWTRHFGSHRFRSQLRDGGRSRLIEALGPISVIYGLRWDGKILTINIDGWSLGPFPMPGLIGPRSAAREWEENGLYHFDVPIDLPVIGRIVRYRGWLRP